MFSCLQNKIWHHRCSFPMFSDRNNGKPDKSWISAFFVIKLYHILRSLSTESTEQFFALFLQNPLTKPRFCGIIDTERKKSIPPENGVLFSCIFRGKCFPVENRCHRCFCSDFASAISQTTANAAYRTPATGQTIQLRSQSSVTKL